MSNDTTYGQNPSSFPEKGKVTEAFREADGRRAEIAQLSPGAQQEYEQLAQHNEAELDKMRKTQQRTRPYREIKKERDLLRSQHRNPAPHPKGVVPDRAKELRAIEDHAKRLIQSHDENELNFLNERHQMQLDQLLERDRSARERTGQERNHTSSQPIQSTEPTQSSPDHGTHDREHGD
ncbi:hypothetical protein [uncultured Roseibium sp.]|uniref:hypothetical protein n=1 Tax=uncultured Roseibium sp. TaxID=1936171 RepID=UPI0032172B6F